MFKFNTPYSGEEVSIPIVTFKDIMVFARLIYENNIKGFSDYFDELFNSKKLNVIDKLFIALKAKELFVNENISLTIGGETYSILTSILTDSLVGIDKNKKECVVENFKVTLGLPVSLYSTSNFGDLLSSIIHTITVDDIKIDFQDITQQQQQVILSSMPPSILSNIKKYIVSENDPIVIYNGIPGKIEPIKLNAFSDDILNFIKLIFSDYDLNSCRETMFYLSKHLSSDTIHASTCADISFYVDEIARSNKSGSGGNPIPTL